MAAHVQQQLLDAYQATLVAAATAAAARVHVDHLDPQATADLPALLMEADGEQIRMPSLTEPGGAQLRDFEFTVTAVCAAATGGSAAARDLAKQVEQALLANLSSATAGGKAKGLVLLGSDIVKDGSLELQTYGLRQAWRVPYVTAAGVPDVPQ